MEGELLEDQPLGQKLIKKWFWLYFFMIFTAPLGYIIKVIVSNTLSVEDVGIFYSVIGLVTLLSVYHDLGLTEALQYFLPKYRIEKKHNHYKTIIYVTIAAQVFFGVIIALLLYNWADRLAIHHFKSPQAAEILKLFCRYFLGINFIQLFSSIFKAFQDVIGQNFTDLSRLLGTLIFTLFFWFNHQLTLHSFGLAWIFWVGIALLVSWLIFISRYRKILNKGKIVIDRDTISKQFKYAFRVFLGINAASFLGQVDQQLVINFLWAKEAGYYTNFLTIFAGYLVIVWPILNFIFPLITEMIAKNDSKKLILFQNILYKYFSVFALSCWALLFAFGPEFASVFFGTKFAYSWQLLSYLGWFLPINILFSINFSILAGIGKVKERMKILGRALVANVCLNVVLILGFKIGILGAVIWLIGWWIVLFLLSYKIINRHQKIDFDWPFFLKNFGIVACISIVFLFIKWFFFVASNAERYHNILWLAICSIGMFWILMLTNRASVKALIHEIKQIRKTH